MRKLISGLLLGATLAYGGVAYAQRVCAATADEPITPTEVVESKHVPTLGIQHKGKVDICLDGVCRPCVTGEKYTIFDRFGNEVYFDCADSQKGAKKGGPSCASQYDGNGVCLNDTLADAFGLFDDVDKLCPGKNFSCYNGSQAKPFATVDDLRAAEARISGLEGRVGGLEKGLGEVRAQADAAKTGVDGLKSSVGDLEPRVQKVEDTLAKGKKLDLDVAVGVIYNGGIGGELALAIGAPVVDGNGHLQFVLRGYYLREKDTDRYTLTLPTATQSTVDSVTTQRYLDAAARFQWDFAKGYFNLAGEAGVGWQKVTNTRQIDILGDVRRMSRSENQLVGEFRAGASGRIYRLSPADIQWYVDSGVNTKKDLNVSAGVKVGF